MANLAILVGNSSYKTIPALSCCLSDVEAVKELLESTGRYDIIKCVLNVEADTLKSEVREAIDKNESIEDLFFYFSGHGHQHDSEFYFCATNFDAKRPNETGLSNEDLHTLIRPAAPNLLVKVIDACHSGTQLIKRERSYPRIDKSGFKNVIQISSCLDSQVSLTGEPLSEFTQSFCHAAVSKAEGTVYYSDVVAALRDAYLGNEAQTPHFISQSTGRDVFAEDALRLEPFRATLVEKWSPKTEDQSVELAVREIDASPPTLLERLQAAETKLATPVDLQTIPGELFDGLTARLKDHQFSSLFDLDAAEHEHFVEPTARGHIIRILHREERRDNFVTADIVRIRKKQQGSFGLAAMGAFSRFYEDDDFDETWNLALNCRLDRAQLRITLLPRFSTLQKLMLVVTCAPSLDRCYVFENLTSHKRTDFETFETEGKSVVKRWYKQAWKGDVTWLIDSIYEKLVEVVETHIDEAASRA